jgi:hypothetical protein
MRAIGKLTTLLLLSAAAVAAVVGIKSLPDLQRYKKMREM